MKPNRCTECGAEIVRRRGRPGPPASVCSPQCRQRRRTQRADLARPANRCTECGSDIPHRAHRGRQPSVCSPQCRRKRKDAQIRDKHHGTLSGWATYHCGCDPCRDHHRLYRRGLRAC